MSAEMTAVDTTLIRVQSVGASLSTLGLKLIPPSMAKNTNVINHPTACMPIMLLPRNSCIWHDIPTLTTKALLITAKMRKRIANREILSYSIVYGKQRKLHRKQCLYIAQIIP